MTCISSESTFTLFSIFFSSLISSFSYLTCLHGNVGWNFLLNSTLWCDCFLQNNPQVVQCCSAFITLQITWLLVCLCYNNANIRLCFPDATLSRGDCCVSTWSLRVMWEWVWCWTPHGNEYANLRMSRSVNTTSCGNDLHVLQVPSLLGLPSSLFVGCCSGF